MAESQAQSEAFDRAVDRVRTMLDEASPGGPFDALEGVAGDFGRFEGLPAKVVFGRVDDEDHRAGTLLEPISYHSPDTVTWAVPGGAWLDGASIPRVLWSLVGSPYTGLYLEPSIVHDHYCIKRDRTWRETHRMFHDAMRCNRVGKARAAVMFYAVYRFGPRWPDPGVESLNQLASPPQGPVSAQEFERDAEAIVIHDLNVDEIAALAETRDAESRAGASLEALGEGALEGVAPDRARLLVVPGGSGTAEDVAAVTEGATQLPSWIVDHFLGSGIRIIACRGSVTDFESDLHGVVPRGWEKIGRTWDSVPGSYFDRRRRVVIATADQGGRRVVPDKSSRLHGSDSLVVHESLHGYDYSTRHSVLAAAAFRNARNADLGGLTTYENQEGQAGLEETFAESGAQFCVAPQSLAGRCPSLAVFWQTMPIGDEGIFAEQAPTDRRDPVGSVTRGADGSLVFDLRAVGDGGSIGHAIVTVPRGDAQHRQLEQELFPPQEGLEKMPASSVLFYG